MKTYYPITFCAEDVDTVLVEMTDEEAKIVDRVLKEAMESLCSKYCGHAKIDLDGKIES